MLYFIIRAANKNNRHFHFLTTNKNLQSPTRSLKVNETLHKSSLIELSESHNTTAFITLHILLFWEEFKQAIQRIMFIFWQ